MKIKKILNNNVIVALDEKGRECVVTGRGLAYGKKAGDALPPGAAEKIFTMRKKGLAEKFSRIIENIPFDYVKTCDEIINVAKEELGINLSESIYLTLTDHIACAIERNEQNLDISSGLLWEVKQFYPAEYAMGVKALDIIEKRLGIRMPDGEAAFIAFHLINAANSDHPDVQESLEMIHGILAIVRAHFAIEFDEDSWAYTRFLTHLRYFSRRVLHIEKEDKIPSKSPGLWYRLSAELPEESACAEKIGDYMLAHHDHRTTENEKTYLIVHLHAMLSR